MKQQLQDVDWLVVGALACAGVAIVCLCAMFASGITLTEFVNYVWREVRP